MKTIKFSAGHGPGKLYNRGGVLFNEGDQNKVMTDKMIEYLNKNYEGYFSEIRLEKGDYDHELYTRSAYGNGADLFYSWHTNAFNGSVRGVEVILSYQSLEYFNFANELCDTISKTLNTPNRGVIFRDFHTGEIRKSGKVSQLNYYGELRNNKARCAILVEHCFHDNITDANSLIKNKDILIFNIAKVIEKNFNLKKKIIEDKGNKKSNLLSNKNSKINNHKLVKVTTDVLNIRKGPGTNYGINGQIRDRGTYTIVEVKDRWGKLKSGVGWISLDYTNFKSAYTKKQLMK